jgi:hypothetical protein
VEFGVTVIDGVVAPLLQEKVPPGVEGVAVKVTDCPAQTLVLFTVTLGGEGVVRQVVKEPATSKVTFVKSRKV